MWKTGELFRMGGPGCPTIPPGERPQGPEEREVSPPSPSLQWFAPDFLIGPSLPFERRATRVARQRQERQMQPGDCCPEPQLSTRPSGCPDLGRPFFSSSWISSVSSCKSY